jgi:hypothetical protein
MKDRVDNFLKVARQRIEEDIENISGFNDLCGSLMELIKDKELQDYLFTEYEKIADEVKLQEWDERFLKVIANDHEEEIESAFYGKALTTGISGSPFRSSNLSTAAPNTALTSASMKQAAQDMLKEEMKQQYKEYSKIHMKDRYNLP